MVLNPVISKLAGKLVVLASASPRRQEILRNAGLRFEVVPSWFKETLDKGLFKAPHEYAVETAKQKALEVARRMPFKHLKTPDIVIGADTIVTVNSMILEKPVDKQDAYRMLSSLSGKEHSVFTGVAIVLCHEKDNQEVDYQMIAFYEETKVKFADLSEDMLWEYINSGEPMDKAGGYGIQALGGMLVEYVHGDFLNVGSAHIIPKGPLGTSVLDQQPHTLEKSSSPSLTQRIHNSSSNSPAHKVKRTNHESGVGGGSWSTASNMSKPNDEEFKSQNCENVIIQLNRQQEVEQSGTETQDSKPNKQDLERICELMDGFKASKALFTASSFCVFDLLHNKPGLDAARVAEEIKASVKGTECLLEACVSLGLVKIKDKTNPKALFENTDLATSFLRSDAPFSLHGYIRHCNETLWPLFSHLESAVHEGVSQHEKVKRHKERCQDSVCSSQELKLRFMGGMHSFAKVTAAAVATAFDLSRFKTACDLGGCTGAMAYEFTKAHPGMSVTVFDLPAVIEMREHFLPANSDKKVSFVAGDFLKDDLPKADLYILARVIHDLTDEKLHILLTKIAESASPGCGLLLSEIFLDDDRGGPSRGLLQALSLSEGKQRSASEYRLLLERHGFITAHIRHTGNLLDAMLSVKA
uniref:Acetylserotonin O-methyltransferase like n=1 Tax=Oryzias latipes TaxID=8090 RepID=A0A3P9KYI0_ORYLA